MGTSNLPSSTIGLFSDLMEIRRRSIAGENLDPPLITLLPKSLSLKGFLIDFIEERIIVMRLEISNDFAFLDVSEVSGIVIHNYAKVQHILMPLETQEKNGHQFYTIRKLDVKKNILTEATRLSERLGSHIRITLKDELPDSSFHLFIIQNLIVDVTSCIISAVERDDILSIFRKCEQIVFQRDKALQINYESGTLFFQDTLTKCYSTKRQRMYLQAILLEALLVCNSNN